MLVLDLLGTLSLRNETHPVPVAAQQKRPLGLLAILGLSGRQGLSRDRIEAYLWPESSGARAHHALDQTVYAIRQALGSDLILSTARELRLNSELVRVTHGSSSKRFAPVSGLRWSATIRGRSWTDFILQIA